MALAMADSCRRHYNRVTTLCSGGVLETGAKGGKFQLSDDEFPWQTRAERA